MILKLRIHSEVEKGWVGKGWVGKGWVGKGWGWGMDDSGGGGGCILRTFVIVHSLFCGVTSPSEKKRLLDCPRHTYN
jgi:hypothetical protein